ncbi:MAG TPA: hypothetical protein VJN19_09485 [Propionibacteriaceae bacterium]|nr:hypothetical protein [Propionibacteriaceae bacterium]
MTGTHVYVRFRCAVEASRSASEWQVAELVNVSVRELIKMRARPGMPPLPSFRPRLTGMAL